MGEEAVNVDLLMEMEGKALEEGSSLLPFKKRKRKHKGHEEEVKSKIPKALPPLIHPTLANHSTSHGMSINVTCSDGLYVENPPPEGTEAAQNRKRLLQPWELNKHLQPNPHEKKDDVECLEFLAECALEVESENSRLWLEQANIAFTALPINNHKFVPKDETAPEFFLDDYSEEGVADSTQPPLPPLSKKRGAEETRALEMSLVKDRAPSSPHRTLNSPPPGSAYSPHTPLNTPPSGSSHSIPSLVSPPSRRRREVISEESPLTSPRSHAPPPIEFDPHDPRSNEFKRMLKKFYPQRFSHSHPNRLLEQLGLANPAEEGGRFPPWVTESLSFARPDWVKGLSGKGNKVGRKGPSPPPSIRPSCIVRNTCESEGRREESKAKHSATRANFHKKCAKKGGGPQNLSSLLKCRIVGRGGGGGDVEGSGPHPHPSSLQPLDLSLTYNNIPFYRNS